MKKTMITNIKYKKPIDVSELEDYKKLELLLKGKIIYIEEKIDGSLSDSFYEACTEFDNLFLCFFGEKMNVKDFHILKYSSLPSRRVVFDIVVLIKKEKIKNNMIYLPPEYSATITFLSGMIFVPILYRGPYISIDEIGAKFLSQPSKFKNKLQSYILKDLHNYSEIKNIERILKCPENLREGVVIKNYSHGNLESYKIVNSWFEKLLKKYPREALKIRKSFENTFRIYDINEYKKYWQNNVFAALSLQPSEKEFEEAYYNYLSCYNTNTIQECIEKTEESTKRKISKIVLHFLQKELFSPN